MSDLIDAAEGENDLNVRCYHSTDPSAVAKHNTKDSCWVILYGNVYDVRTGLLHL